MFLTAPLVGDGSATSAARLLLFTLGMIPEDNERISQHIVEIPSRPTKVVIVRRRSFPVLAVAACLGLTGVLVGVWLVGRQRASDEHLTSDALQREELRDGWKALGAVAAIDAQTASAPSSANSSASAPPSNVLIVNVPGQAGPQGPPGAPGAPGQPGQTVVVGAPGNSTTSADPNVSYGSAAGNGTTYVTAPVGGYGVPIINNAAGSAAPQNPASGVVPSGPSGLVGQSSGNANGSGSSNPALPGNGSSTNGYPTPGAPNGSLNIPNSTPNLPSGTSNLPTGSSSLPSGVP